MDVVECGGKQLDCTNLVQYIQSKGASCTLFDLRSSKEMAAVVKQYSDSIGNKESIPVSRYDWFICVVVGSLIFQNKVRVGFNPF